MESNEYPQTLTEDERDLGFRLRVFDGLWEWKRFPDGKLVQPAVVARILSSFEILVKICDLDDSIYFTHQRHGCLKCHLITTEPGWHPASGPYKDAAMFIHEYEVGLDKLPVDEAGFPFIAANFNYRDV